MPAQRTLLTVAVTAALTLGAAVAPARADHHWLKKQRITSTTAEFTKARGVAGAWMYGDSITVAGAPDLAARFKARGRVLAYDANSGIPTGPAVDRLAARINSQGAPYRLVMALGSNDTNTPAGMAAQIDRVMKMVPSSTRVYWVNVWKKQTGLNAAGQARDWKGTATINAAIAAADKKYPNLATINWFGQVQSNKANPTRYFYDGLHTLDPGKAARNSLITNAVAPTPLVRRDRVARVNGATVANRSYRLPWFGLPAPSVVKAASPIPSYFYRTISA